jgi:hypothetical protein
MRYFFESKGPFLTAVIITIFSFWLKGWLANFHQLLIEISKNALSISVTFLGFLLTILTLINSIDTRRMRYVKDKQAFPRVIKYLKNAIQLNILIIGVSFLYMFLDENRVRQICYKSFNPCDHLYFFIFIWTLASSLRFTKIFVLLLSDPKEE